MQAALSFFFFFFYPSPPPVGCKSSKIQLVVLPPCVFFLFFVSVVNAHVLTPQKIPRLALPRVASRCIAFRCVLYPPPVQVCSGGRRADGEHLHPLREVPPSAHPAHHHERPAHDGATGRSRAGAGERNRRGAKRGEGRDGLELVVNGAGSCHSWGVWCRHEGI